MPLKSVNLNLIPVLRALLRHKSVTAAGHEPGRSPTAISEGLAKLRATFDDPLLIKSGARMVLTPRAIELIDPVEALCAQLENLLHRNRFDPLTASRVFVIAATDIYVCAFGPALVEGVVALAPHFRFRFIDIDRSISDRLALRDVDAVIMPAFLLDELPLASLNSFPLTRDEIVVMMRDSHPLSKLAAISPEDLASFPHVAFHSSWQATGHQVRSIARHRRIPPAVYVADAMLLPYFVSSADKVSLVPRSLCEGIGQQFGLIWRPLAKPEPDVCSVLAWNPVQDADPAHKWLRTYIHDHLQAPDMQAR